MDYDPNVTEHAGPWGTAIKLPDPDPGVPMASKSVCNYILTVPSAHPIWSQYGLYVIRLREIPGEPPPKLKFDGATHEILVMALNPDHGPWDAQRVVQSNWRVPYLLPINIAEQFEATDEEMVKLADLAAQGVVQGILTPETADAPTRIREGWLSAMVKTLAHIRGEEHAP